MAEQSGEPDQRQVAQVGPDVTLSPRSNGNIPKFAELVRFRHEGAAS